MAINKKSSVRKMNERKKLKWIQIENFRGIKKAKLQEFGDINVFIGKNNTGKSTVLEAIYLNLVNKRLDLLSRRPIEVIFYRRGLELRGTEVREKLNIEELDYVLSQIFNSLSGEYIIRIHSNVSQYELVFKQESEILPQIMEKYTSRYQFLLSLFKRIIQEQALKDQKSVEEFLNQFKVEALRPKFVLMTPDGDIVMIVTMIEYRGFVEYEISIESEIKRESANVVLIDEYLMRGYLGYRSGFSGLLKSLDRVFKPKLDSAKELLTQQIGIEIKSIKETLSEFYIMDKNGNTTPISLLGDGTKASLIYFYALSGKDNYVLLEEPENHLHPGLMDKVISMILEASKYNQIFITTHNLEFLEKLLDMGAQRGANLKVFSFKKLEKGKLTVNSYNLEEANAALNKIGVDLR